MNRDEMLKTAKPILFNTDMVRAILEGRKTQTRRARRAPNCKKGDILYVRETWTECHIASPEKYLYRADYDTSIYPYSKWSWHPSIHMPKEAARIFLKVTDVVIEQLQDISLQDVLNEGAKLSARGTIEEGREGALKPFAKLWDSTTPKRLLDKYGWDANPYVMVIEFERVTE